ncbi:MAG TPA: hypothetical protein DCX23_08040 [Lachnospiraceae bacterium]|jgi:hypothetical protein|nr:hypothetical protein [Erysipelotrichaceae bacterium]HAV28240.1 hypothetical protein [Lachnospiraceae bacterium]
MAEDVRSAKSTAGVKEFEAVYDRPHCIVLDSAYCSMGRMIGFKACQIGGYEYYDAVILLELVPECGVTSDDVAAFEKKLRTGDYTGEQLKNDPEYARLAAAFDKAADIALAKGPCLIHDRLSKEEILKKGYSCTSVFTFASDLKDKIVRARISPLYCDVESDEEVIRGIHEEDSIRINWHRAHSDTEWGQADAYDLCINTDAFGRDYSAELIAKAMKG